MQIWIIKQWQTKLLHLFSMGLTAGLAGCVGGVQTLAPVATAKPQWLIEGKQGLFNTHYTVQPGDTLWRIANMNGVSVNDLASQNQIINHHCLQHGQVLQIQKSVSQTSSTTAATITTTKKIKKSREQSNIETNTTTTECTRESLTPPASESHRAIRWHWPTNGKIIERFSSINGGNRGIDMAGTHGQDIYGCADGRIVYVGNALGGYGNLLIIKHGDDYLSAYAHNATILVREQQLIKAKQKIATMGSSGTNSVRLHFEIRYKGKSVDPLRYLPSR